MPWKNGAGTTTEIVVEPAGGIERFLYRLSIADVATDGPFSRFDGYDRHIMLLEGAGMTLDCGPHGVLDLTTRLEPRAFRGEWDVVGSLSSGPVRDFNLIVDRAHARSSLSVRNLAEGEVERMDGDGGTGLVYVAVGALSEASTEETLVAEGPFEVVARGGPATIALARVIPRER